jgi:ubiquinone/menaquinone biosynthesis C-methylase UbiE
MSNPSDSISHHGYVMDAENAAEMARLMLQDRLLTQAMGGLLPEQTNLSQIHTVLDVACGPGGWLLNVVTDYPSMHGIGIDISNLMIAYANSLASSQNLSNVQFHVMDVTKPLQFPESTFDLVNGRILTGFLSKDQWSALLQECYRITQPGGILRLTEAEWGFTNSPALDKLQGLCALALHRAGHSFSPHGRTFGTCNVLRFLLLQAGYEDIKHMAHAVDFSAGTALYDSNIQNMLIVQKQLQFFLQQMHVATLEELEYLHAQMEAEMQKDDFCAVDYYLTVWGRKSTALPQQP